MQRTPGVYTEINTQTQRTGLPNQNHTIVLVTSDAQTPTTPMPIYDTTTADAIAGEGSNAGQMMAAALSVSQGVRVDVVGKSEGWDGVDSDGVGGGGSSGGGLTDFATLPVNGSVTIDNREDNFNNQESYFSIEVNGVMYNADKSGDVTGLDAPTLYSQVSMYRSSDGSINFSPVGAETLEVRLSPTAAQRFYSDLYLAGEGAIEADGTFVFKLGTAV